MKKFTATVLMGYPGSGKTRASSYKHLRTNDVLYLSSDDLRVEMFGFRDQEHNKELFEELYKRAINYSDKGGVLIDSTALTRKDRLRVIAKLGKYFNMRLVAVVRPIWEIVEENQIRKVSKPEEYIPEPIFKQILGRFQLPTYDEGWDEINFCFNSSIEEHNDPNLLLKCFYDLDMVEDIPHDNPHHPESIKEHVNYVLGKVKEETSSFVLESIAYYHDLGKFYVIQYNEEKGYSQCIGHAAVSAYIYLTDFLIRAVLDTIEKDDFTNPFSNLEFLLIYYGVFYHDYPYSFTDFEDMVNSLSKPSKPLIHLFKNLNDGLVGISMREFARMLIDFNCYDRMREGNSDDE